MYNVSFHEVKISRTLATCYRMNKFACNYASMQNYDITESLNSKITLHYIIASNAQLNSFISYNAAFKDTDSFLPMSQDQLHSQKELLLIITKGL